MVVRQIKAGLLLGVALVLVLTGTVGALLKPELEPDQVLSARFGDVTWSHDLHARMPEIVNCQVCHHKDQQGTMSPRPCRHCHQVPGNRDSLVLADLFMEVEEPVWTDENGPPVIKAAHGKCIGCHRAMNEGPVECRDCHQQIFSGPHGRVAWDHLTHSRKIETGGGEGARPECVSCHHQDAEAQLDGDFRPCGLCHKPSSTMKLAVKTGIAKHENAEHGRCGTCHTVFNPEDDPRTCKDCHQEWVVDTETRRPTLEQAIHQRCRKCHTRDNPDLVAGMPSVCSDCHSQEPSFMHYPDTGPVMWDHNLHARYGGETCDKCHHTDLPGAPHMACSRCHGTGLFNNPPLQEALGKRCIGCHKENEQHTGLLTWAAVQADKPDLWLHRYEGREGSFWWDHGFHAVGGSFACRDCHHTLIRQDGIDMTALRTGKKDWPESAGHPQSCRNCHGSDGPVSGSPADGTDAPRFDQAFKKVCIECHRRLRGGPQAWEDYFKVEPVKPAGEEEQES